MHTCVHAYSRAGLLSVSVARRVLKFWKSCRETQLITVIIQPVGITAGFLMQLMAISTASHFLPIGIMAVACGIFLVVAAAFMH